MDHFSHKSGSYLRPEGLALFLARVVGFLLALGALNRFLDRIHQKLNVFLGEDLFLLKAYDFSQNRLSFFDNTTYASVINAKDGSYKQLGCVAAIIEKEH
jgi:hypothetical protein